MLITVHVQFKSDTRIGEYVMANRNDLWHLVNMIGGWSDARAFQVLISGKVIDDINKSFGFNDTLTFPKFTGDEFVW